MVYILGFRGFIILVEMRLLCVLFVLDITVIVGDKIDVVLFFVEGIVRFGRCYIVEKMVL